MATAKQPIGLPIRYMAKVGSARLRFQPRVGSPAVIRFAAPQLEMFVHIDLKPNNILVGAGMELTDDISATTVIESGIPAALVRDFAVATGMSAVELGQIVGASERTMSRKVANGEQLGPTESDRAFRLFDVIARAIHAFGDVDKGRRWVRRAIPSLGGRTPIELLRTEIGTREVLSALDRIEFGGVA